MAMDRSSLEQHYRSYIAAINAQQLSGDNLSAYVHDRVTHNGVIMSRLQYQDLIAKAFKAMPDIQFTVNRLLVDTNNGSTNQQVGCRITFDNVHPTGGKGTELLGMRAGKDKISFSEHVFYHFEDGRIREVWSLLDTKAFEGEGQ